jgi:hypothetical protein
VPRRAGATIQGVRTLTVSASVDRRRRWSRFLPEMGPLSQALARYREFAQNRRARWPLLSAVRTMKRACAGVDY